MKKIIHVSFLVLLSTAILNFTLFAEQHTTKIKTLTMDQAVEQALKHRPDLEALVSATESYKAAAKATLAGHLPSISMTASMWQDKGQRNPAHQISFNVNQLVYSFSGPLQHYKQACHATKVSELGEEIYANQIRLAVEKTFIQCWLLQEQKNVVAALKKSTKATFDQAKHQNKLNLLDKQDWLSSTEQHAKNLQTIDTYEDNYTNALKNLEFLLGYSLSMVQETKPGISSNPTIKLDWKAGQNNVLKKLSIYHDQALKNRPELKQTSEKIAVAKADIGLAQGTRLPTVSVYASAGNGTIPSAIPIPANIINHSFHSVGATLSWSLFDGGISHYQEKQARANKIKEILNSDQVANGIKQEVNDKYYALSQAQTAFKAQKISYLKTSNDFNRKKQELDLGLISKTDFQAAKTTWEKAQLDWLTSKATIASQERELVYACGYPKTV